MQVLDCNYLSIQPLCSASKGCKTIFIVKISRLVKGGENGFRLGVHNKTPPKTVPFNTTYFDMLKCYH